MSLYTPTKVWSPRRMSFVKLSGMRMMPKTSRRRSSSSASATVVQCAATATSGVASTMRMNARLCGVRLSSTTAAGTSRTTSLV